MSGQNNQRVRKKLMIFYVDEEEEKEISSRMELLQIKNKSVYFRQMVLKGYIINKDFISLKKVLTELSKIGTNINQIAKVVNTYGANELYQSDLIDIKKDLEKIW